MMILKEVMKKHRCGARYAKRIIAGENVNVVLADRDADMATRRAQRALSFKERADHEKRDREIRSREARRRLSEQVAVGAIERHLLKAGRRGGLIARLWSRGPILIMENPGSAQEGEVWDIRLVRLSETGRAVIGQLMRRVYSVEEADELADFDGFIKEAIKEVHW